MLKFVSQYDIDNLQWELLVSNSPTPSYFQTKECFDFYSSLSFLSPFLYGVSENERLVGLVCGYIIADGGKVKPFFSRRAIVPGGLLLDKCISDDALEFLLTSLILEIKRKAIYIEIRNYNDFSLFQPKIETCGFIYHPHYNYQVDTTKPKLIFENLSESKRRQLRMSQSEDVTWHETNDKSDVNAFYACLHDLYKTKVRLPLFPLEFFEKLVQMPNGKLLVVKHENKVIGGMACVILANNTLYEWFVCGDNKVAKRFFPSVVATYAGIDYASKNNISRFDFMGAGKPDKNYGVRNFKSKFGGKLVENGRFLYICNKFLYLVGKLVVENFFSKHVI